MKVTLLHVFCSCSIISSVSTSKSLVENIFLKLHDACFFIIPLETWGLRNYISKATYERL